MHSETRLSVSVSHRLVGLIWVVGCGIVARKLPETTVVKTVVKADGVSLLCSAQPQ